MDPDVQVALRGAFATLDADGSGEIAYDDLLVQLKAHGHLVRSARQLKRAMSVLGTADADAESISFAEFAAAMASCRAKTTEEMTHEFLEEHVMARVVLGDSPMYVQLETMGAGRGQVALARLVDGPEVQLFMFMLIIVDVVAISAELLLRATHSAGVSGGGQISDSCAVCEREGDRRWHATVHALHSVSLGIIVAFGVQIAACMLVYRAFFFKEWSYVADLFIIGLSLLFELALGITEGNLFLCLLGWRAVRILHGVAAAAVRGTASRRRQLRQEKREHVEETLAVTAKWGGQLRHALSHASVRTAPPADHPDHPDHLEKTTDVTLLRKWALHGHTMREAMHELHEHMATHATKVGGDAAKHGGRSEKKAALAKLHSSHGVARANKEAADNAMLQTPRGNSRKLMV